MQGGKKSALRREILHINLYVHMSCIDIYGYKCLCAYIYIEHFWMNHEGNLLSTIYLFVPFYLTFYPVCVLAIQKMN